MITFAVLDFGCLCWFELFSVCLLGVDAVINCVCCVYIFFVCLIFVCFVLIVKLVVGFCCLIFTFFWLNLVVVRLLLCLLNLFLKYCLLTLLLFWCWFDALSWWFNEFLVCVAIRFICLWRLHIFLCGGFNFGVFVVDFGLLICLVYCLLDFLVW